MELEIKGLKADKSLLEEDILKLFDAVDQAKGAVAREKDFFAGEEKKFKAELDAFTKRAGVVQGEVSQLDEKRKEHLPGVEPKLLSTYERILKSRMGLALVPVRNNACSGCNMELPPQMVNEIHMQDKLIVCESCARILYWPQ